jgi:hypothetical protein
MDETTALHRLADGLVRVADEMEAERLALQRRLVATHWRRLVATHWRGLAAEAVRGVLSDRLCALSDARERHLDAAEALEAHARLVESRRRLLVVTAHAVESLFS